jgi:hypothetical protein
VVILIANELRSVNTNGFFTEVTGDARNSELFHTNKQGPFEYVGNARLIGPYQTAYSNYLYLCRVAISTVNPALGYDLATKTWRGNERRRLGLNAPGKRKEAMSPEVQADLEARELALLGPPPVPATPVMDASSSSAEISAKRRRITSD